MQNMNMNMNRTTKEVVETITEGIIKAIDSEKNMVTISHDPIPAIKWPAMTMAFSATPKQLTGLSSGDHVAFSFGNTSGTAKIEFIEKMK